MKVIQIRQEGFYKNLKKGQKWGIIGNQTPWVKPMNEAVFYFDFYYGDDQSRALSLLINDPLHRPWAVVSEEIYDAAAMFEDDYGVHDVSSAPVENVDAIGFTSYEVEEEEKQLELMEKWRQKIVDMFPGIEVSDVQRVKMTSKDDDLSILNKTKKKVRMK